MIAWLRWVRSCAATARERAGPEGGEGPLHVSCLVLTRSAGNLPRGVVTRRIFAPMDLFPPKPDQVVAAAGNVAHKVLYGGLADLRPMPRTLIDDGELREVYHYRPAADRPRVGRPGAAGDAAGRAGDLLRPAPRLLPGRALRHPGPPDLPRGVRPGVLPQPQPRHGALGRRGPARRRSARSRRTPAAGRCTSSAGASAASSRCSPRPTSRTCRSRPLTVVGSPVDVQKVPLVAPLRPLLNLTDGRGAASPAAYRALGGVPQPLVNWAFTAASAQKVVTKPVARATHLDDADFLAQIEAVDRFTANMIAYPGRTFGQLYHRFVKGNALAAGAMRARRPDHRAVRHHRARPGLRRRHRRHRARGRGARRCWPC